MLSERMDAPTPVPTATVPVTAIVLTYQEEQNLAACLDSLAGWVRKVVVVDSGSTDATIEIAQARGARVLHHPFTTHAEQWRWAIEKLGDDAGWVLGLDADQRVTPELRAAIEARLADPAALGDTAGFYLRRRQIFRGRWIRHGGYYPKYLLKLFRADRVRLDTRDLIDHHFYVDGPVERLAADLVEENRKEDDISFWIDKHNRYAVFHAREEFARRHDPHAWPVPPRFFGTPDERVVWLKRLWYRMPLYVRPVLYFVYRYFLRLGFLDGRQGFVFHVLQGFWYRLLVDVHLDQLRSGRRG